MKAARAPTALIAPLTHPSAQAMRSGMDAAAAEGADLVECRLDRLERPDGDALKVLLSSPPLPVIATCRPVRQQGGYAGPERNRLDLLEQAARLGADLVDLELDVLPGDPSAMDRLRRAGPRTRIILSHHDFAGVPTDLDDVVRRLTDSPADVCKVVFLAPGPEDALTALGVLRACRKPAIALAMGEPGLPSRVLARKFGAFATFAALAEGAESAPGQLTLAAMKRLYRWEAIGAATAVYGVIACPVAHSMSPAIHNAAFEATGTDAVYLPLRIEPGAENFNRFLEAALACPWLDLRGLSVTIPHKENALARVGAARTDELAVRIGAVNTIRLDPGGAMYGWNTDYAAALDALCSAMGIAREQLAGRKVGVLGAGGAARAIVAGLRHCRADVTIYNRTVSRARRLAEEFSCRARGLEALGQDDSEILINCTSVGMHPNTGLTPLESIGPSVRVVFDTVYNPLETRLLRQARQKGLLTVSGLEMFVNQAAGQFQLWTDRPAPRQVMRQVALARLGQPGNP